jgi:RND family efflux transporter MFP subunit
MLNTGKTATTDKDSAEGEPRKAMQQIDEGMSDARESQPSMQPIHQAPAEPTVVLDPEKKLGRGFMIGVSVAALVFLLFIVAGIRSRVHAEDELNRTTQQDAIQTVEVTNPTGGANSLEITLPANTQAYIDTPIFARTSGYLKHWYADIGTRVHQGQVLADIETPELDQQVEQVQSDLATAQSNLQIAQITAERWKKLLAKNAVSKQEADQATSDFTSRQSAVSSAQANLRRVQQLQSFEKIYAPFDGVITARNVDIGSLIQAGDSNSPHGELFHMAATDKLRLYVPVPEVSANAVHNGEKIAITSDSVPNEKFTGTVVRNSDSIDMSSRTLNVEVDVDNSAHKLRPGQYAFVHIPIPPSNASMTLPSNTLLFRAEGLRVGVVRDGKVQLTPVTVGHDYGATVEIVSGLSPQDQVILNPSDSLSQGQQVHVQKEERE